MVLRAARRLAVQPVAARRRPAAIRRPLDEPAHMTINDTANIVAGCRNLGLHGDDRDRGDGAATGRGWHSMSCVVAMHASQP
jgi:hypothetical protein